MKVKDLLKHDLPPTDADAHMRKKHTMGSIQHQMRHIKDHAKALVEQTGKLHTVDSKKAHSEAQKAYNELNQLLKEVEKCLHKKGC